MLALAAGAYCQHAYNASLVSVPSSDKISLVKNSISVSEWHEKSFWSLYNRYSNEIDESSSFLYSSLDSLLKTVWPGSAQKEFQQASNLLTSAHRTFEIRQRYYTEMGNAFNGVIALEFLQAELLMSILENLKVFENNPKQDFHFYPWLQPADQFDVVKREAIINAIKLSPEEITRFFTIYNRYEQECDDFLGENYNLFEFFNEEPADFTPGLAKGLGYNLLQLMQREMTMKEKYFKEMNKIGGPSLAARFILWEDYFSTVNKMYAWSDGAVGAR